MDLRRTRKTIPIEVSSLSYHFVIPSYFDSGVVRSSRAPVGHAFAQMPQEMHLKGSVCFVPLNLMLAEGQKPTHMRQDVHLSLRTCTTPLASRSSACVGQTSMHAPHWLQTLMLGYVALFSTVILESAGESSLNHALEHADMHSLHVRTSPFLAEVLSHKILLS